MKTAKLILALLSLSWATLQADDHSDTRENATRIISLDTPGVLENAEDIDWFRIEVNTPGRHWFYTSGNTDTQGDLYDETRNWIAGGGNDQNDGYRDNFFFSLVLQRGIYYLRTSIGNKVNNTGAYTISVRQPETARTLSTPNLEENLSVIGDRDLYRVHLDRPSLTWFYTTGSTDTYGTLYDKGGNFLAGGGNDQDDGSQRNFRFTVKLQPGTYYLLVTNGNNGNLTGNYTLSWRHKFNAIRFTEANRVSSLGVLGDLDLYEIPIHQRAPFWIYSSGNTDTYGTLYDDAGTFVAGGGNDQDDGAGRNFLFSDTLPAGRYYLLVEHGLHGNLTGAYGLHMRDRNRSTPLLQAGTTSHSVSKPGDLDLFSFSTAGGSYRFESTGTTDTYGTLYRSGGEFQAGGGNDQNDGIDLNFAFEGTLPAGDYYLLVAGADLDLVTGSYQLKSTFTPAEGIYLSEAGITVGTEQSNKIAINATGAWTLTELPSWITASTNSGTGSGTLTLNYSENLTGKIREADLQIGGQTYRVTQRSKGDFSGQVVPGEMSIELGILVGIQTQSGITYRIETSDNMTTWLDTGVTIQGDGTKQEMIFASAEARNFFRAVPQ